MRAAMGPLKKTLIKPSTLKTYQFSLQLFYLWLAFWSLSWPSDRDELDTLVSQFAEAAWEEGESRSVFACLVSRIPYLVPSLRNPLLGSRKLITAWDKSESVTRSFPISEMMAFALAGEALACSWSLDAAAILIGFAGMFRVMELLGITACEVSGTLSDESLTVQLVHTKTSNRKQIVEKALIKEPKAAALLLALCSDRQPGDQIFQGLSPKQLPSHLRQLSVKLGLGDLLITPHLLRRGKATARFRQCGSFHVVADEGRWESLKTCRKYVDEATKELASYTVDPAKLQLACQELDSLFQG